MKKIYLPLFILIGILSVDAYAAEPKAGPGEAALEKLMTGNRRFLAEKDLKSRDYAKDRKSLKASQKPFATILACSDSRVPPSILFDQGLGDLFVIRVAGNTPDDFVIGSIEYAVGVLKTPLVLVMGHQNCGAVEAALSPDAAPGHIDEIIKAIRPAVKEGGCPKKKALSCAINANVEHVVKKLKNTPPILQAAAASGDLLVKGSYYDFKTGRVILLP